MKYGFWDWLAQDWESEAARLETTGDSVTERTMNRIFAERTRTKIAELKRHAESAEHQVGPGKYDYAAADHLRVISLEQTIREIKEIMKEMAHDKGGLADLINQIIERGTLQRAAIKPEYPVVSSNVGGA